MNNVGILTFPHLPQYFTPTCLMKIQYYEINHYHFKENKEIAKIKQSYRRAEKAPAHLRAEALFLLFNQVKSKQLTQTESCSITDWRRDQLPGSQQKEKEMDWIKRKWGTDGQIANSHPVMWDKIDTFCKHFKFRKLTFIIKGSIYKVSKPKHRYWSFNHKELGYERASWPFSPVTPTVWTSHVISHAITKCLHFCISWVLTKTN